MRILLVGSKQKNGSLTPYIANLADDWSKLGHKVTWIGSNRLPYDITRKCFFNPTQITSAAWALIETIDWNAFDIVSLHFGKLEIEQLFPLLLNNKKKPPIVYHVHSTDWDLFKSFVPEEVLYQKMRAAIFKLDSYIFFGTYALKLLGPSLPRYASKATVFYPASFNLKCPTQHVTNPMPHASMVGFYSPWKDVLPLVNLFTQVVLPLKFTLAGPLWDQVFNFRYRKFGQVEMHVNPTHLHGKRLSKIMGESDFGLFPYTNHPCFQGSAAVSDYLFSGTPVLGYDAANLGEYIGKAGLVVPYKPYNLINAINKTISSPQRIQHMRDCAQTRAKLFDKHAHAKACCDFFEDILKGRTADRIDR